MFLEVTLGTRRISSPTRTPSCFPSPKPFIGKMMSSSTCAIVQVDRIGERKRIDVGVSIETLLSTVKSTAIAAQVYTIRTSRSLTFDPLNNSRKARRNAECTDQTYVYAIDLVSATRIAVQMPIRFSRLLVLRGRGISLARSNKYRADARSPLH